MARGVGAPLDESTGGTVVFVLLIAGYANAITTPGVSFTTTLETGVYLDSAWHVGSSGITCKGWLELPSGSADDPPPIAIEESATLTEGTFEVAALTLVLADVDSEVTVLLGSRLTMPRSRLSATLTAAATTVNVEDTSTFASSGTAYVGREAITYTGKTSSTLTGCTRGAAGTIAQPHRVLPPHRPPSVFGSIAGSTCLPSLVGRRATLWRGRLVGTELQQPTLVYDGRVGPGITLHGAGYAVPVDHVSRALSQCARQERITLAGYHHGGEADQRGAHATPLFLGIGTERIYLGNASGAPDRGGWHATREEFINDFRAAVAAASHGLDSLDLGMRGDHLYLTATDSASFAITIAAAWREGDLEVERPSRLDGATHVLPDCDVGAMPEACFWWSGTLPVSALDAARIPTLPSNPVDSGTSTYAYWSLLAKVGNGEWLSRVTATAANSVTIAGDTARGERTLITEPVGADLALEVSSTRWDHALRYGLLGVVAADLGVDHAADAVDWAQVSDVLARSPIGALVGAACTRRWAQSKNPLDALREEALRYGLALAPYRGRISVVPLYDPAPTEESGWTITTADLVDGTVPRMTEVSSGLVTRMKLALPSGDVLTAVDLAAEDELGQGQTLEVQAPPLPGLDRPGALLDARVQNDLVSHAQLVLGPWSEPYRIVTLSLTLAFVGAQIGDVADVSVWLLPNGSGTRGVSSRRCLVVGRRARYGEGLVELDLRLGDSTLAGYAPEVMVGDLVGAVVTVDTTWLGTQGVYGFSERQSTNGTARADGGASWFAAGDKVALHEVDATSPAAPWSGEVLSVSSTTITLTASPGASWETLANTQGKVLLAYDGYGTVVTAQKRFAFIADSTYTIGADGARRWS